MRPGEGSRHRWSRRARSWSSGAQQALRQYQRCREILQRELGDVMRRAGDVTRSGPLDEEAAQLLELTEAAIGAEWADYLAAAPTYLLAQLRWHNGRYVEALDAAERALAAARSSGDPRERSQAYEVLALACHALGDWQRGVGYKLQRQQLAVEDGFDVDEALEAHLCLWEYHLYGDRPCPEVEASARATLQRAESVGNVRAIALCQHALGSVLFLVGRWPESHGELGRSIRLVRSVGAAQGEVIGSQRLGLLDTAMGRLEDGYERLRQTATSTRPPPTSRRASPCRARSASAPPATGPCTRSRSRSSCRR